MAEELDSSAPPRTGRAAAAGAAIWKGLNSPIVLFLLSSVVLTTVTQIYSDRQAAAQAAASNRAEVGRLLLELEFRVTRLRQAGLFLRALLEGDMGPAADAVEPMRGSMIKIISTTNGTTGYSPTATEFKDTHLISLMQQIDLKSGTSDSRRFVSFEGASGFLAPHDKEQPFDETPLDAGLGLGEGPLLPHVDPPYLRRAMNRIDVLQVYVRRQRFKFLCAPDAPGRDKVLDCQDHPDALESTRLNVFD